jgi:DNA-binding response OmpR family regulator
VAVRGSVLIAEDNVMQAEILRRYLSQEGYAVRIVHDGRAALDEVRRDPPDLLLLDVMMPRVDGLDVARVLRAESNLPMLMLTARSTEDDLLLGLDLGADDYMTKPYSPRELMARVRTLLRRVRRTPEPAPPGPDPAPPGPDPARPVLAIGALVIDPDRHELRSATTSPSALSTPTWGTCAGRSRLRRDDPATC